MSAKIGFERLPSFMRKETFASAVDVDYCCVSSEDLIRRQDAPARLAFSLVECR